MHKKVLVMMLVYCVSLTLAITISSLEELQKIGFDPSYPLTESYTLTADIDASLTKDQNEGKGFLPIAGGWGQDFTGTFDGAGYTISNLYINSPDSTNDGLFVNREPVGLFGYVGESGVVKNLKVENARIHGFQRVAIIAGYTKGTIQDCEASGVVTVDKTLAAGITAVVGGIVDKRAGSVKRCIARVDISGGRGTSGGIVAWAYKGEISECASFGSISSRARAGGIIGACNGTYISRCFSTATISVEKDKAGGLAGEIISENSGDLLSTVSECWAAGSVTAGTQAGGLVGAIASRTPVERCYWDRESTGHSGSSGLDPAMGLSTEEMLQKASFQEWDFTSTWKNRENISYPSLSWMEFPTSTVTYTADEGGIVIGETEQHLDLLSVGTPVTAQANDGSDMSFIRWNDGTYLATRRDVGVLSDTTFTAQFAAPKPINSIDDLMKIGTDFEYPLDYNYYVTADIHGNGTTISSLGGNATFKGSIDGKGYTLEGIEINGPLFYKLGSSAEISNWNIVNASVNAPNGYAGVLVGINKGTLSNITISESEITSHGNMTGGLAGILDNGTIKECQVSVNITTDSLVVGGLVGFIQSGIIERAGADGSFTGSTHVGGLVGFMKGGSITEAYTTGSVTANDWSAGGLVATLINGDIQNSYALADVNGGDTAKDIGGLIGRQQGGRGSNCFSAGSVNGFVPDRMGGLIGYLEGGEISDCFWDTISSGMTSSLKGTGLATGDMSNIKKYQGWDFNTIWIVADGGTYPSFRWQQTSGVAIDEKVIHKSTMKGDIHLLSGNRLALTLPQGVKGTLKLYRVDGRQIFSHEISGSATVKLPNIAAGVVITRLTAPGELNLVKPMIIR